jgi:tryptophanyl-tRNA synthetase
MSKSRGNAISLAASEDETARRIKAARTDGERDISYAPERRPEVSNLILLAALSLERSPEDIADELGGAGAAGLKQFVTDALNECLRPIRDRRRRLASETSYLREVLAEGVDRASAIAEATLGDVRTLMHTTTDAPRPVRARRAGGGSRAYGLDRLEAEEQVGRD